MSRHPSDSPNTDSPRFLGLGLDLKALTKEMDQPFYLYDLQGMVERLRLFRSAFSPVHVHYAMKANANPHILKAFAAEGIGVDAVSGGEIAQAIAAGFPAQKIVFSGVGKTVAEIEQAVGLRIQQINVESPQELRRIGEIAARKGQRAPVALRMNPDVNPVTHPYIKTGFRENKFGMDSSFLPELRAILKDFTHSLDLVGLTLHIGSQIRSLEPLLEAIDKTIPIYKELKAEGFALRTFDVGGGVGLSYERPDLAEQEAMIKDYGAQIQARLKPLECEILCEPGRILVASYGWLLGEVQYIKTTPYKNFAILNTGIHHLMRPALYQAFHRIEPVEKRTGAAPKLYDIVGPICESADVLGFDRLLPEIEPGDWLAVCEAGAYGFVMASHYNSHQLPREVVVVKGQILSGRSRT